MQMMEQAVGNVVTVASENEEMEDAIHEARASINIFFTAFKNPQPNQTSFLIKARFEEGDAVEHIWLADLDFRQHPATGVIANDPGIETLSYMQRVPFLPDQISDWMYMQDGQLVGGFTTKLLLRAQARQGGLQGLLKRRFKM